MFLYRIKKKHIPNYLQILPSYLELCTFCNIVLFISDYVKNIHQESDSVILLHCWELQLYTICKLLLFIIITVELQWLEY